MNSFKKIMSAVVAAATLMAGIAFPISATNYDPYDVNHDGVVSPADTVYLSKYLNGVYAVTNYNQLDVNRSLTVDAADLECLEARIMEKDYSSGYYSRATETVLPAPTVSGFTPSESSQSTAGRRYKRCRYDSNGQPTALSGYTLTPTVMTIPEASPRLTIGDNNRYSAKGPENNGIVYLDITYFDDYKNEVQTTNVTGFIVGDHQIATAAHCIYRNNRWNTLKIKIFDIDGYLINTYLHPVEGHIPLFYVTNSNARTGDYMYDYGLITVSDDLSNFVHFSLGTPYNISESDYSNIPVYVTGCPNKYVRLDSAEGRVLDKSTELNNCTDVLFYDTDTIGGQSGSPVYTITKIGNKYVYTAIAVHHGVGDRDISNAGSMITDYHLQFYLNNPNAGYSAN